MANKLVRILPRVGLALLLAATGCEATPQHHGTGAKEMAQHYYDALWQRDWRTAYADLDADSRSRCGEHQFASLGAKYWRDLGFVPQEVHLRSCDEHGDRAVAHVTFTGLSAGRERFHKDGIVLRCQNGTWQVVLSPKFGQ